jgi:hypothetical protein
MKNVAMTALFLILALFLQNGNAALMQAASSPKPVNDVRILLKAAAAVQGMQVTSETVLFNAFRAGADNTHVKIVWALLEPEAEPAACGGNRVAALSKAGEHGNPARVQALVASGADVSPCDRNGETPLLMDAATGYQEAVGVRPVTGAENSVPPPYG